MEYLDKVLGVKVTYEDVQFKHGVTVLDAAYLIPFKAKAWMDLTDRKAAGFMGKGADSRCKEGDR